MHTALRYDDRFEKNVFLSKVQTTKETSTVDLDTLCNTGTLSKTYYKNGQVRIYPNLSPKCLDLLYQKYSNITLIVEAREQGRTQYLELQQKAFLELGKTQILALSINLKKLDDQSLLAIKQ